MLNQMKDEGSGRSRSAGLCRVCTEVKLGSLRVLISRTMTN